MSSDNRYKKPRLFQDNHGSTHVASYNEELGPVLDSIEKLRSLSGMDDKITLPTIAVVGDQSAEKSSVIEALAGIYLPKGFGICTRLPLIIKMQHSIDDVEPQYTLECQGVSASIAECKISYEIKSATDRIIGPEGGISTTPLTLTVKRNTIANMTLIDLPGVVVNTYGDKTTDLDKKLAGMVFILFLRLFY